MLKLDRQLIERLSANMAVTVVSATNGKSTTTRMIAEALRSGAGVAHNSTGANMAEGIVTALAASSSARYAAIEVDEAHLPAIVSATNASQIVLINLSRDQLDRGSEVKMLAQRWRKLTESLPSTTHVFANSDDPLVVWAAQPAATVTWVSAGHWWHDDAALCPNCGAPLNYQGRHWACPACLLHRPASAWGVTDDAAAIVTPSGSFPLRLALPGRFNVGNASIALAALTARGIDPRRSLQAFASIADVDGRYVQTSVDGTQLRLLLGKNPASWAEMMKLVEDSSALLVTVLNARGADGRDPSWIWDVPFEDFAGRPCWVAGERRFDLAVRLDTAGLRILAVSEDPLDALAQLEDGQNVDVVANYTAFQELRARLVSA
jgi:UDP-N-acetylmuramyl tripeptide synthase